MVLAGGDVHRGPTVASGFLACVNAGWSNTSKNTFILYISVYTVYIVYCFVYCYKACWSNTSKNTFDILSNVMSTVYCFVYCDNAGL